MSLQGFQSALAYVIRNYDPRATKSIDELAHLYQLSPEEIFSLDNVINQQRLQAYREELFLSRWTIIRDALEFLQPLIDFKELTQLWEEDFEPRSSEIVHEDLALRFTDYMVTSPKAMEFIRTTCEPFVPSLMRYVNMVFTFKHNILPKHNLSEHSCLTDRSFAIVNLDYDVREYFADLIESTPDDDVEISQPVLQPLTLLFVATDEVCDFRSFEIDERVAQFLRNEIGLHHRHGHCPDFYRDLVELGICKGQTSKTIQRSCCSHH